ncbi:Lactation elevated protein 1 [Zancudomyces culisetae]|uniref:Lactation elevated protein 1 n=1 Tax=Zancudomyces culisetae TaxID=1213189 RepID=A0A1R1PNB9_ZANCU|nr:Lactation elevated protein 1 [Zancudomyces culisetae]|eukprot:OMH82458.1 Lactation elevated protein 1 [Zancudomyces culisetae]
MVGVHRRVQEIKEKKVEQPIRFVAKEISEEAKVLCFDEFQVTDIADAMILRQLTTELFEQGVVLISTSNRGPDELYKNGLQRASFIPCIQMIKEHCQVVNLDSGIDYRKHAKPVVSSLYLSPNDQNNSLKLMEIFYALCGDDKISTGRGIKFLGREFIIPKSTENVALIDFGTLCKEHHGAVDYLEIFKSIKVLVLHDVPQMGSLNRDEARRFITLVDTLYEKNVLLVMSSQVDVYQIFRVAKHEGESSAGDVSVLYTGEEELFAFERTLSRLVEMNGADYLKKAISRYPPARFLLN